MATSSLALSRDEDRWSLPAPLIAIADEHKYVSRLLVLLEEEAERLGGNQPADLECMADILNYIIHYPDRYHHPKEELIFDRMGHADERIQKIIRKLRRAHNQVSTMGEGLWSDIQSLQSSPTKKKRLELAKKVSKYIDGLRAHIQLEESQIFKPAITLLSKADWKAIDKEIKPIIDPVFGEQKVEEFAPLFGRYLNRVVTVSTGMISPGFIEKVASSVERLLYATGELRQLPGRLVDHAKNNNKAPLVILKELCAARDIASVKELIKMVSDDYTSTGKTSLSMLRDAFLVIEPLELEGEEALATTLSLKDEDDFLNFDENNFTTSQSARISWQAMATNLLFRTTIKQLMAHMGPDAAKHTDKLTFLTNKVPPQIEVEDVEFDTFRARWIRPEGLPDTQKTILYLPGGGFIFPATSGHTSILSTLTKKTRAQGFMVHYRLAPDHPFPAGLEDAIAAYKYLLHDQGISPEDIVLGGDSAGGGLALSLLLAIRDEGLPMPKAVTLMSPLADLSFSGSSRDFNRWRDPMLPTKREMNAFEMYSGDTPADSPLLSPVFGDLSGLPPMFTQVGSTEILLDDTLRVARKARGQGVEVEVEVWNSLPHVWHLFSYIPESEQALTRIAEFFNKHFQQPSLHLV